MHARTSRVNEEFDEIERGFDRAEARAAYQDALDGRLAEDNARSGVLHLAHLERHETVPSEIIAMRELGACLGDILYVLKGQENPWSMGAMKKAQAHLDRAMELVGKS